MAPPLVTRCRWVEPLAFQHQLVTSRKSCTKVTSNPPYIPATGKNRRWPGYLVQDLDRRVAQHLLGVPAVAEQHADAAVDDVGEVAVEGADGRRRQRRGRRLEIAFPQHNRLPLQCGNGVGVFGGEIALAADVVGGAAP